jgi:6-phosphofructokinase 1
MVALHGTEMKAVPLAQVVGSVRTVPPDHPMVVAARAVGTRFGDETVPLAPTKGP